MSSRASGQYLMVLAEREPRVDQPFPHVPALLEQRGGNDPHKRAVGQVGERRVAPQAAGLLEQPGRVLRAAGVERGPAMRCQAGEAVGVELARLDHDPVPGRMRDEAVMAGKCASQVAHAHA